MKNLQRNELISKKCNEVIENKKKELKYIGRTIPYGYKIDKKNKQLIKDKNSSHVVYTIFDLYDKGYGFTTIADYLNERGIITPSRYLKEQEYISYQDQDIQLKWEKSSIRKIILNKVYNGSYKYTNIKTHDAIIDDDLWNSVQNRFLNNMSNNSHNFYDKNGNEFCGKVYCSECKMPFTVETSICKEGTVKYLRCSCYDKRGIHKYSCNNKLAIRYDELRDIVEYMCEKRIFSDIDLPLLETEFKILSKNDKIKNQRYYLKQEKNVLNELINKYTNLLNEIRENNLYNNLLKEDYIKKLNNYNIRLDEIETMLKELYSLGRIKTITNKEIYLDKFIIDNIINRIEIGTLIDNTRNINIIYN